MPATLELAVPLVADPELSLEALYQAHHPFVWRNARRLGCSDAWVDDAVHEVFLVVANRLQDFEGRSSPRTWLFAITYRVVLRMQRDRTRYAKRLLSFAEQTAGGSAAPVVEASRDLRELLLQLAEPKRLVFILVELEGFTAAEIAHTLGISAGTVATRLRAARLELERILERQRARERSLLR